MVGNTIVSTGASNASNVTGGTLIFDSSAAPAPGPISVLTTSGNALQANGGAITVPNGAVSIQTGNGHAVLANGSASTVDITNGASINLTGLGGGLIAIGGTVNATGVAVNATAASSGHGAVAESGGTVNLHAGTSIVTGGGFNAVALGASGAGSRVTADALIPVTTNGRGAMGIYLHDGGQVSLLPGSTFQINGTSSVGVAVDNTAVTLGTIGSGLTINLNGAGVAGQAGSTGVVALNGGRIALDSLTVTGPNAAVGVWAQPGTSIALSGASTININAAQNQTFYTLQTANLVTTSGSVGSIFSVTGGIPPAGLFAPGGSITSVGTTINVTSGNGAAGAYAGFNGTVDMTSNTIVTSGANSFGVRVDSGQVTGRNSQITTSGGGAALFFNFGPGVMNFANTQVQANGAGTAGLASLNLTPGSVNSASFSGGSLISGQSTAIQAQGPLNVSFANGTVVTGGGGFLLEAFDNSPGFQSTVVQLNASGGSQLTGDAMVDSGSIANISLATGSQWTGAAFNVTNVAIDPSSIWTMTANSTVSQTVANAGQINYTPPTGDPTILASYKTLTTANYVGAGGSIRLNTFLGSDGSPSDRLVINGGTASGTSALRIANTVGPGALTTGNGIQVVSAINNGTTGAGAFALGGPVAAGPFEYLLFKGGVTPGADNDWFLRSSINCSLPNAPVPPCTGPNPPNPPNPPEPIPLFRPEASLYTKVPLVARQMALFTLGTFHERQGDQILLRDSGLAGGVPVSLQGSATAQNGSFERGSAAWGRVYGQTLDQRWSGLLSPEFDGGMVAMQLGVDLAKFESVSDHSDNLGVFYAHADARGDGRGFVLGQQLAIAGTLHMTTENIGAYWTHIGPGNWYIDAVLMGTFFDGGPRSTRGIGASFNGEGVTASLEGGLPFRVLPHLTVEAQGQLIFQHTHFDPTSDPFTTLSFDLQDNLVGRFGLRLEGDVTMAGAQLQPFAFANLWHAFQGTDSTLFNSAVAFPTPFEATALELGGGVVAKLSDRIGVYARGSYTTNIGGNFRQTAGGQLGVRWIW